jgi:2,4-dienoyl-CoA reductase-like NADH-dependent reductase (Old Yellow Enzyme family)
MPDLFSPFVAGDLSLANRIVMACASVGLAT